MEKDPNGPQTNPPPPRYDQLSQPTAGYPTAAPQQVGYAGQPGYGAQPGAPGQPGVIPGNHLKSGDPGYAARHPGYGGQPGYPDKPRAPGYPPGYCGQPGQPVAPAYGQPSTYIVQPGLQQTTHVIVRERPNNYLGFSIFVCLCCCLPLGLIGIVYSSDSTSKFDRGDDAGAVSSANSAKSWSMAGLVIGIIWIVIYIILQVTVFAQSSYSNY